MTNESEWDVEVDVLVVGTGAAGMTAALAAKKRGVSVLMVESAPHWGGTTSWSGGAVWAPNNSLMPAIGASDTREEALAYINATVSDLGVATSPARREAFVDGVREAVDLLCDCGVDLIPVKTQPDYYTELPDGKMRGRTLECSLFDVNTLGPWAETWNGAHGDIQLPLRAEDVKFLIRAKSSWQGFSRAIQLAGRIVGARLTGKRLIGAGGALSGYMFKAVVENDIDVWLSSPLRDLVVEGEQVVGALVERQGRQLRVRIGGGLVIAAGGFARRHEWREKFQGVHGWSSAADDDLGTAIEIANRAGAALALMDQAWWIPAFEGPDGRNKFVLFERSMPHSIIVNQHGKRYVNESASYDDVGAAMLRNNIDKNAPVLGDASPAVPSWLIADRRLSRRYLYQPDTFGKDGKQKLRSAGTLVEADTIEELADATGLPRTALLDTIARFNEFAKNGVDEDFGRGDAAYDRIYSDPSYKPNPNLGTLERAPFTALKLFPGDAGTKGGILTNEKAEALCETGTVMAGLYAAGNSSASVMADTYPGGGSTLGPAIAFGYVAGRNAAANARRNS